METLWFETALLADGWARDVRISHADGLIATVEAGVARLPGEDGGPIGLPGLSNLHSHAFQRGMAGLAERRGPADDDFWTWREVMYRFLGRLTPEDVAAISGLAYVEMLESGFTRVGEFHYLHNTPDGRSYGDRWVMAAAVARAAEAAGIGLTLLPVFYAHGDFGGAEPSEGQRRFILALDAFADLVEAARRLVWRLAEGRVGVAPHSLRAVTERELALIAPLAGDGPVHIHAAEQIGEVDACRAWSGAAPVEWLLSNAEVDARWCLVHTTHVTDAEVTRLAASGAVAGLCPITEANLGDGVFPGAAYLAAGGRWGVGTDSNVLIDAAGELRALEYGQRLSRRARNVLAPREGDSVGATLFTGALAGGARALGVADPVLGPGAAADMLGLNANTPALCGAVGDAILDRWIFAARDRAVDKVWRAGRKVVEGGRHLARDSVEREYRARLPRLLAD